MKTLFKVIAASAAVLSMASCQKMFNATTSAQREGESCQLFVDFSGAETKVPGLNDSFEKNIKDVQVFVFNKATGKIDASMHQPGLDANGTYTMTKSLNCTRGEREVWALVNAPVNHVDGDAANRISTIDQLKSVSTRLVDNKSDALVMVGSEVKTLAADTETVSVKVQRVCAAVVIQSIKNEMGVPAYQTEGKVRITGAYLLNVPNSQRYDLTVKASTLEKANWISPGQKSTAADEQKLTADSYPSGEQQLNYGSEFKNKSTFYAYPNDATAAPAATWTQCATVLVVEALVDGQPCIYPVRLGVLQNNHKYAVSLTLKHIGGDPDEPWKKVEFTNLGASITITDWSTGAAVNESI